MFEQPVSINLIASYLIKDKHPWSKIIWKDKSKRIEKGAKADFYFVSSAGIAKYNYEKQ